MNRLRALDILAHFYSSSYINGNLINIVFLLLFVQGDFMDGMHEFPLHMLQLTLEGHNQIIYHSDILLECLPCTNVTLNVTQCIILFILLQKTF